jgi:hypothetical protein
MISSFFSQLLQATCPSNGYHEIVPYNRRRPRYGSITVSILKPEKVWISIPVPRHKSVRGIFAVCINRDKAKKTPKICKIVLGISWIKFMANGQYPKSTSK